MHIFLPLTSFASAIFLFIKANSVYEVSVASVRKFLILKFVKPDQLVEKLKGVGDVYTETIC
jgi:hypothetical protein